MPQARLPDINTAFITYRREVLLNLKSERYSSVFGSLFALNALLPEKYRIEISTPKYDAAIRDKEKMLAVCKSCTEQVERSMIKPLVVIQPFTRYIITEPTTEKIWFCPKCNAENLLSDTHFIQTVLKEPSFHGVVPSPVQRHEGLMARSAYHKTITSWVWLFLDELEEKMALFRDDNWTKTDSFDQDYDFEGGEEED